MLSATPRPRKCSVVWICKMSARLQVGQQQTDRCNGYRLFRNTANSNKSSNQAQSLQGVGVDAARTFSFILCSEKVDSLVDPASLLPHAFLDRLQTAFERDKLVRSTPSHLMIPKQVCQRLKLIIHRR